MKIKNRRSLNRIILSSEELEVRNRACDDSLSGRKRKSSTPRTQKGDKPTNCTLPAVTQDCRKSKRKGAADNGASHINSIQFKSATSLQSNSCSSASSMVSADATDPYEFAVKPEDEEEISESLVDNTHQMNTGGGSIPHIKKIKLDRVNDCSRPDSARSSPFPQAVFSQPSPGANSSPLGAHCTRPLSVMTDFSASSASSSSSVSCSSLANRSNSEQENPLHGEHRRHHLNGICKVASRNTPTTELPGEFSPSALSTCLATRASVTPVTTPAVVDDGDTVPPSLTNVNIPRIGATPPRSLGIPSPVFRQPCSVTCSTPDSESVRRCVGVNTILDSCKETTIEPDLLGPCEPGTTIRLNGIVWLETTTGVLVVNVTWRGRTYIGTLLDATQHDFAPPCPRDYVPPFKQSVRSSNRSKRRNGLANGYKPHYGSTTLGQESNRRGSAASGGNHRHRLRGRSTTSPTPGVTTSETTATNPVPLTIPVSSNTDIETGVQNQESVGSGGKSSRNTSSNLPRDHPDRADGEARTDAKIIKSRLPSGSEVITGASIVLPDGAKREQNKHRISGRYSISDLENLPELTTDQCGDSRGPNMEAKDSTEFANQNDPKPPILGIVQANHRASTPVTNPTSGERCDHKETDEELDTTFPITCPLEGCRKRFTHVIALRFHLNHTRHAKDDNVLGKNTDLSTSAHSAELNKCEPNSKTETLPEILPLCSRNPASPASAVSSQKPEHISTTDNTPASSVEYVRPDSAIMHCKTGVTESPCTGVGEHSLSIASQQSGSRRTFPKVYATPHFNGSAYDASVPPPVTRTVTAHTVSIPHGSTLKSDSTSLNGPGVATTKHRPSLCGRTDSSKPRGQCGKLELDQTVKLESQAMNHTAKRNSMSSKNALDIPNFPPFASRFSSNSSLPPRLRIDGFPTDSNDVASFAAPLAPISREQLVEQISLNSQLLTLPPGVWNFSSALENPYETLVNRQPQVTFASTTVADMVQQSSVQQGSGSALTMQNHSHQQLMSTNSAVGLNNFASSISMSSTQPDCGFPLYNGCNNSVFRHAAGQHTDASSFYGMPNFLVEAAMTALGTSRVNNCVDLLRSYTPGFADDNGPKAHPSMAHACQFPLISSNSSSTKHSDPSAMNSVSLGPQAQPSTFMLGSFAAQPFMHGVGSSINGGPDRLDPFKLSAAYFMQQATAGSQLPSAAFGQQST